MVRIEKTSRGWKRLIADRRLWREDFFSIARTLRRVPFCAYKVGEVAARIARKRERIQTFGPAQRARGGVRAYRLIGGFDIVAPWGERMAAESGFLILNGDDVYGAHRDAFHRSYAQAPGRLETKIPVESV